MHGEVMAWTTRRNISIKPRLKSFLAVLPFVREFEIHVVSVAPGQVVIELPFEERFSGPPGQFPASMVGVAGDVAAVSSCLSLLPKGWALATLDFTIKMTGVAKGEKLRAKGQGAAGRSYQLGRRGRGLYRIGGTGNALRYGAGHDPQFPDQVAAKSDCVSNHAGSSYPIADSIAIVRCTAGLLRRFAPRDDVGARSSMPIPNTASPHNFPPATPIAAFELTR